MDRKECIKELLSIYGPIKHRCIRPMERHSHTLSKLQLSILHIVKEERGCNMTRLASLCYISKQHMTKAVDGLCQLGYVKRCLQSGDRRAFEIVLTSQGSLFLEEWGDRMVSYLLPSFDDLDEGELLRIQKAAREINQILRKKERKEDDSIFDTLS